MDLELLRTFERIVREGSFSRAAWALGIPQPTVSARMRVLERELGGALFRRSGQRMLLTDLGAGFLPYAERALVVLGEGIEVARQVALGQRGRIALGALGSLAGEFLGPALVNFHVAHPQVEIVVRSGRHEALMELLRDGVVELALIAWPCTEALDLALTCLLQMQEPVVLVVPRGHPLAQRRAVSQNEIVAAGQPFLLLRWWQQLHPQIARLAQRAHTTIDVPMETARAMVLGGAGIGFFTERYIADAVADGAAVAVRVHDLPPIYRASALVRVARETPPGAAALALVASLRERARQLQLLADAPVP